MAPSKKKALMTMSEPVVNGAQPHVKPAKRLKKWKTKTNVDSGYGCPSFSRLLMVKGTPKDTQISSRAPTSTDESTLNRTEGDRADVTRRCPAFEETLGHLFGPDAEAEPKKTKPRRRWELDTQQALFGPEAEGQITASERPRHYDIFELHRQMRTRPRKQQLEDTHGELFGEPPSLNDPVASRSDDMTHDRLFGEHSESAETETTGEPISKSEQYWDVFEPYRGMKRRRKKHRHDAADTVNKVFAIVPDSSQPSEETKPVSSPAAFSHKTEDTHRKLFAFDQDMPLPSEESKPVCSPARFTHKTPKVIKDVVCKHLQPLFDNDVPQPKTGKACLRPYTHSPLRNPVTWDGFAPPSRNSIVMPDRMHRLKPAADGVTVAESDRNPVTGERMPLRESRYDGRRSPERPLTYRSQFVIADHQGTPPADSGRGRERQPRRYDGRRSYKPEGGLGSSTYRSQFIIADPQGTPPPPPAAGSDREGSPEPRCDGRRSYDARRRMYNSRNPITDPFTLTKPPDQYRQRADKRESAAEVRSTTDAAAANKTTKRRVVAAAACKEPQRYVLAWDKSCRAAGDKCWVYTGVPSLRCRYHGPHTAPVTAFCAAQADESADSDATLTADPPDAAEDSISVPTRAVKSDDFYHHYDDGVHDDEDDEDEDEDDDGDDLNDAEEGSTAVGCRRSA